MSYHAEFGRSALKDVGIDTGKLPKLGNSAPGMRSVADTKIHAPPRHVLHVKFGSSAPGTHK